jgi:uncharacterized integral membrane protein
MSESKKMSSWELLLGGVLIALLAFMMAMYAVNQIKNQPTVSNTQSECVKKEN